MLSSGIAADSCQGDSGGPLACANPASSDTTVSIFFFVKIDLIFQRLSVKMFKVNEMGELLDNSRFTLWGITSFGKADESTGFACSGIGSKPGMYTKVASYMDWINAIFKSNSIDVNA